ncbi:hypothetical protein QVD17_05653 [Tagetes erecta]|uniref:Uncharacterized protein n=1 Tax=Tagetes erecta TaxID=13708 RepID=A0AAD8PBP6_TARER|nr:hypothetical protein QVD17_05653 [Tagetes erecta]
MLHLHLWIIFAMPLFPLLENDTEGVWIVVIALRIIMHGFQLPSSKYNNICLYINNEIASTIQSYAFNDVAAVDKEKKLNNC